ncbi:MAG: type I restriction-modification protein subunit S [Nitrospirales bacterium]|nr:MAG: type I restriction-modification protein subunit S [Nitrospirales bacterium]
MTGKYQAYSEYKDSGSQWLGDIPNDWDIFNGKRLFKNRRELSLSTDEQLAASQKYGVVPQYLMMELNESKVMLALKGTSSFRHVEKDDFVISLRSFEGGIEHSHYVGCVSPAYTVLSPTKDIAPSFYRYLLKSKPYIAALQSTTDSLRDGKSITFEQFGAIPLVLPKVGEQNKIASFLDYETAKIDTLIEKQQQLIKLLKEKRQAVISQAVTKGLNPNAPMRDSGIEWLGEVPAHWKVKPLKFLISDRKGAVKAGPFGSHLKNSDMEGSDIKVVAQKNVISRDFDIGESMISSDKYRELEGFTIFKDDILVSTRGTIGRTAIYDRDSPAILHPCLIRLQVNPILVYPEFIALLIQESGYAMEQILVNSNATTIEVIYSENLINTMICLPPSLPEQKEVLNLIAVRKSYFDSLISKAESAIELMQERRTALISAAVTGKIDVRNWKAPEPSNIANNKDAAA